MKSVRKIAVLMGGPSEEREVSLRSGAAVARGLMEAGYDTVTVDVVDRTVDIPGDIDLAFIALHGTFGEDGEVQALLDERGIKFTGSGVESSRVSFDKKLSKQVLKENCIPTPEYEVLRAGGRPKLPFPLVVKPPCQGSSIGIHMVRSDAEWEAAATDALSYGDEIIVETYIKGKELTVGIVGDDALPVVQIVAPEDWYDYGAKYTAGKTEYLVPAPIPDDSAEKCKGIAMDVFKAMNCRSVARVDFRMGEEGDLYVLELNSIPGFTETSLLPKAAAESGMTFSELCDRIVRTVD